MPDPQPNASRELRPGESVLLQPMERLCQFIAHFSERVTERRTVTAEEARQAENAMRLLRKLLSFALPPGPELTREELQAGYTKLARLVPPQEAQQAYYSAGDYRRGRPGVRRHVAAVALEVNRDNPRMTRLELAKKLCACGKAHHGQKCAERLRRDILRLKALLREILSNYPA
jgi:hypothetical protein